MIEQEYKYFEKEVINQRALEFEMSSQGIDYLEAHDLDSNKKNQGNPGNQMNHSSDNNEILKADNHLKLSEQ